MGDLWTLIEEIVPKQAGTIALRCVPAQSPFIPRGRSARQWSCSVRQWSAELKPGAHLCTCVCGGAVVLQSINLAHICVHLCVGTVVLQSAKLARICVHVCVGGAGVQQSLNLARICVHVCVEQLWWR